MKKLWDSFNLYYLGSKFNKKYIYLPNTHQIWSCAEILQEYGFLRRIVKINDKILIYLRNNYLQVDIQLFVKEGQLFSYSYKSLLFLTESAGLLIFTTSKGFCSFRELVKKKIGGFLIARFF